MHARHADDSLVDLRAAPVARPVALRTFDGRYGGVTDASMLIVEPVADSRLRGLSAEALSEWLVTVARDLLHTDILEAHEFASVAPEVIEEREQSILATRLPFEACRCSRPDRSGARPRSLGRSRVRASRPNDAGSRVATSLPSTRPPRRTRSTVRSTCIANFRPPSYSANLATALALSSVTVVRTRCAAREAVEETDEGCEITLPPSKIATLSAAGSPDDERLVVRSGRRLCRRWRSGTCTAVSGATPDRRPRRSVRSSSHGHTRRSGRALLAELPVAGVGATPQPSPVT